MKNIVFSMLLSCISYTSFAQLLALSKNDHTLAIVDPVSLKVLAKVPVGADPHEVIASSDGRTAYVSIYGGGSLHEIDVIDLAAQKALPPIDTKPFFGPHGLDFADGKLWFTAEGSKCVVRLDPATGAFDWAMGTGQDRTHMVAVAPGAKTIYTTNVSSGTVSVLEETLMQGPGGPPPNGGGGAPRHTWTQTLIPVSRGCEGFDVTGQQLWTASAEDGKIYIIDLATRKVTATIDAHVQGANRLQFTPDGTRALITSLRNGDLVVYDVATHKDIKHIPIGHGAAGILVSPDGARAFIGCTPDNYLAVVDLKTLAVTGHIDVGGGPDGLAWVNH
ncbi:cytochrome D1 domain-containing protein [Dinghuibacter silviterrae]|uniref:YVTN family beta-propeller protein n=1 Tax=Dinghuibacter silviterrae TaxID=1539049 RepID=A0A4R8DVL3_9BACT|nr:cytochrome D1 domain-containing protein [Dinghuibacter silviterrae]TDX02076.1 YVTN family beta-propeller protein [Dinghuibacter silviterrae]